MLQMVATDDTPSPVPGQIESPGTFGKLRQTLSSSLLTAQDKGIYILYNNSHILLFFYCDPMRTVLLLTLITILHT